MCNVLSELLGVKTFLAALENTVPCLFCCCSQMACACLWELDHSPGSSANGVDTCLLQVKCLSCSIAGEMDVHQSDHLESHQSLKGHCFQLHHQLPPSPSCCDPTGTHQEELLLQAGPVLVLSCSPLLSLGCLQAGCWHPHRGQMKSKTG